MSLWELESEESLIDYVMWLVESRKELESKNIQNNVLDWVRWMLDDIDRDYHVKRVDSEKVIIWYDDEYWGSSTLYPE